MDLVSANHLDLLSFRGTIRAEDIEIERLALVAEVALLSFRGTIRAEDIEILNPPRYRTAPGLSFRGTIRAEDIEITDGADLLPVHAVASGVRSERRILKLSAAQAAAFERAMASGVRSERRILKFDRGAHLGLLHRVASGVRSERRILKCALGAVDWEGLVASFRGTIRAEDIEIVQLIEDEHGRAALLQGYDPSGGY